VNAKWLGNLLLRRRSWCIVSILWVEPINEQLRVEPHDRCRARDHLREWVAAKPLWPCEASSDQPRTISYSLWCPSWEPVDTHKVAIKHVGVYKDLLTLRYAPKHQYSIGITISILTSGFFDIIIHVDCWYRAFTYISYQHWLLDTHNVVVKHVGPNWQWWHGGTHVIKALWMEGLWSWANRIQAIHSQRPILLRSTKLLGQPIQNFRRIHPIVWEHCMGFWRFLEGSLSFQCSSIMGPSKIPHKCSHTTSWSLCNHQKELGVDG
jgi:hypothetical protein